MPEDYQDIVLAAYKMMRDNGKLRTILTGETTTRLREACLRVYDSRYIPKDADTLSMFFKKDRMECDDFRKVIYNSVPDDYKALYNHIKGGTGKTKEENTDLLAWIIGFPTSYEWMNLTDEEKKHVFEEAIRKEKPVGRKKIKGGRDKYTDVHVKLISQKNIIISCIILLFISTASFAYLERRATAVREAQSDEKFMYWDEDHYEPIKDDKQNVGVPIIPLNVQMLTHQRKINLPDTLTSYSIGKVWYKGHGKDHEFFTDSGAYPLDLQRVLKPLTNNILTKYTSNDRYMLTRLVWFICAAFFISLCGFAVSRLEKEVKPPVKEIETETEKEEIPEFHSSELQATNA